jgi:hypothetical protein
MTVVELFAAPALALTAQLFQVSSDTVVDAAVSVIEHANTKGAYLATFDPITDGAYLIVAYDAGTAIAAAYVWCDSASAVNRSGNYADVITAVEVETMRSIALNKTVTNPSTGIMTVYDEDDVTPLLEAQLHEDAAESQTYRGRGAEVRGRLA